MLMAVLLMAQAAAAQFTITPLLPKLPGRLLLSCQGRAGRRTRSCTAIMSRGATVISRDTKRSRRKPIQRAAGTEQVRSRQVQVRWGEVLNHVVTTEWRWGAIHKLWASEQPRIGATHPPVV